MGQYIGHFSVAERKAVRRSIALDSRRRAVARQLSRIVSTMR